MSEVEMLWRLLRLLRFRSQDDGPTTATTSHILRLCG